MTERQSGYVLGIDLGTTNYKAGLYDARGELLGLGSTAPQYDTSPDGRVELPVEQMHELVRGAFAGAVESAGVSMRDVRGVGYSTQANTFLLADEHFEPLTPFVVWTDHRAKEFPEAYQALAKTPEFLERIGFNGIAPGMMAANVGWYQQHEPETWARTRYIMTLPDYLVFQLTGKRISDSGVGALLGLWDIRENRWWAEAVQAANLREDQLPELHYPGTVAGMTSEYPMRQLFGLPEGIPVAIGSLDHHVAAIGAGAGKTAPFSISTGTVLAATVLDDRYKVDPHCNLGPGMLGDGYYRLAWHNHGTRSLNWYRDTFAPTLTVSDLLEQAKQVDPAAELPTVELCPWDCERDKVFSDGHVRGDHGFYTLAILKSMSMLLRRMLMDLQPDLVPQGIVVTGGGARCDLWMKMIADDLQAPVYRSASEQAGCLGAAVLAAVGAGWYESTKEASAAMVRISDCMRPGDYITT